jgi:replicative DNA helicase
MSQDQILAKLISYVGYQTPIKSYYKPDKDLIDRYRLEAHEILQGYKWTETRKQDIQKLIDSYKDKAKNLIVLNPRKPNIDTLLAEAKKVYNVTHKAPILFIDYIQLLQGQTQQDTQTILKEASKKLKDYAIDYDTLVFTITAYNRDSTRTHGKATLESGRDTSDIEYSSDYILSINFMDYEAGNSDADIELLKKGDEKTGVRKMTLKVLKNRLGTTGDKINYDFDAKYNTYIEADYFKENTNKPNTNANYKIK